MDLLASLAALTGQTYNEKIDSQNTLGAFLGNQEKGRSELVVEGMFNYAYRQGDYVMIPPYNAKTRYELYNIKKDPGQKNNIAEQNPRLLRQMMMRLEQLKRETGKITNY